MSFTKEQFEEAIGKRLGDYVTITLEYKKDEPIESDAVARQILGLNKIFRAYAKQAGVDPKTICYELVSVQIIKPKVEITLRPSKAAPRRKTKVITK